MMRTGIAGILRRRLPPDRPARFGGLRWVPAGPTCGRRGRVP
jgi:hypothetical protein